VRPRRPNSGADDLEPAPTTTTQPVQSLPVRPTFTPGRDPEQPANPTPRPPVVTPPQNPRPPVVVTPPPNPQPQNQPDPMQGGPSQPDNPPPDPNNGGVQF
ncbi:MAG: hypothetical protein WCJ30_10030, partial [Deltaproteobacteria bacterium]